MSIGWFGLVLCEQHVMFISSSLGQHAAVLFSHQATLLYMGAMTLSYVVPMPYLLSGAKDDLSFSYEAIRPQFFGLTHGGQVTVICGHHARTVGMNLGRYGAFLCGLDSKLAWLILDQYGTVQCGRHTVIVGIFLGWYSLAQPLFHICWHEPSPSLCCPMCPPLHTCWNEKSTDWQFSLK